MQQPDIYNCNNIVSGVVVASDA